jgi:hypothetical protein
MKILVLAGWYPQYGHSGNGIFIVRHAEALLEAGYAQGKGIEVDLMAVQPRSWMQGTDLGSSASSSPAAPSSSPASPRVGSVRHWVEVYEDGGWGLKALWRQFKAWRALLAAYKAHHGAPPDRIVAEISWKSAVVASCIGLPYVVVEHWSGWLQFRKPFPWWQRLAVYRALRRASGVFAVSTWLADAMRSRVTGLQVGVLPNAVEEHFWSKEPRASTQDSQHFLHISDLAPVKNPEFLKRAWVQSGLAGMGYRLRIAGEYTASRQEGFRGIQGIEWLGVLDSPAVARELREARALLLPSQQETFSVLTVESLLCYCPVWMGYGPLRDHYRGHPLVKGLDTADPEFWAKALKANVSEGNIPADSLNFSALDAHPPTDSNGARLDCNTLLERCRSMEVGLELLDIVENMKA